MARDTAKSYAKMAMHALIRNLGSNLDDRQLLYAASRAWQVSDAMVAEERKREPQERCDDEHRGIRCSLSRGHDFGPKMEDHCGYDEERCEWIWWSITKRPEAPPRPEPTPYVPLRCPECGEPFNNICDGFPRCVGCAKSWTYAECIERSKR